MSASEESPVRASARIRPRRPLLLEYVPVDRHRRATQGGLLPPLLRAGPLPPNGQRVVWDLLNIFSFDDQGRLVEEWVRTDYRSFLRQLATEAGR